MSCCRLPLAVLLLLTAGCFRGPAMGQVRGKVTFKGKPVREATITFLNPTTGYATEAELQQDGSYVVKTKENGLVVGEYIVTVNPLIYLDSSDPKTPPSPTEKPAPDIPEQYRNQGRTSLRATVKGGPNEFNFELGR